MSYEGNMLVQLAMPTKQEVENAIITTLFKYNGNIKEFSASEEIVTEIADSFSLNQKQREAVLERIYRKENRIVKTPLWHRLLYRAADALAKMKLITRPTDTVELTNKKEWMLTEKGVDYALRLLQIPLTQKEILPIKSFEVQKEIKNITETPCPENYIPFEQTAHTTAVTKTAIIRARGFRQAVIESYDYTCCICGLKINAPNSLSWEVEAAHIVPHGLHGKDDIWNGIALCRLHHWAFDVGWFTFSNDYRIVLSSCFGHIPGDFGKIGSFDFFRNSLKTNRRMLLPQNGGLCPHKNALEWHRKHIFYP
jgi:5-methylcytosine-specific restriction endonuclease McrA